MPGKVIRGAPYHRPARLEWTRIIYLRAFLPASVLPRFQIFGTLLPTGVISHEMKQRSFP